MATVYRAYDQRLGVPRAIKVMLPAYAEKPRVRARFEAEARTMAVLDHPSIVRVYDVGSNNETAWIVMELVEGGSLLQKIGSTGISVDDCLRYAARVLEALEVAHRHGVVHRDIKPHNVLLTLDGEARITDFGIARSAGHTDESFTKTGTVMGTWAFMAPEQRVNAKGVDHTADLYGLGATLFAMATGQTPMDLFAADLDPEMLVRVPEPLLPIIRKATQYQREQRYPSASVMLEEVSALRASLGVDSQPVLTPVPQPTPETAPAAFGSTTNVTFLADEQETATGAAGQQITDQQASIEPLGSNASPRQGPQQPEFTHGDVSLDDPLESAGVRIIPNRDRAVFVLIIILALSVGGGVKRLIKPTDPVLNSNTPPTVAEPTMQAPTPPAEPTPAPVVAEVEDIQPPVPDVVAPQTPEATTPEQTVEVPTTPVVEPTPAPPPEPEPASDVPSGPASLNVRIPSSVRLGGLLTLSAQIDNLRPIDVQTYSVTAYYRATGTAAYKRVELSRVRRTWTGRITVTPQMDGGIDIFFRAKTSSRASGLEDLLRGSNRSPIRVRVSSP